jgi:hypothetical protein
MRIFEKLNAITLSHSGYLSYHEASSDPSTRHPPVSTRSPAVLALHTSRVRDVGTSPLLILSITPTQEVRTHSYKSYKGLKYRLTG